MAHPKLLLLLVETNLQKQRDNINILFWGLLLLGNYIYTHRKTKVLLFFYFFFFPLNVIRNLDNYFQNFPMKSPLTFALSGWRSQRPVYITFGETSHLIDIKEPPRWTQINCLFQGLDCDNWLLPCTLHQEQPGEWEDSGAGTHKYSQDKTGGWLSLQPRMHSVQR